MHRGADYTAMTVTDVSEVVTLAPDETSNPVFFRHESLSLQHDRQYHFMTHFYNTPHDHHDFFRHTPLYPTLSKMLEDPRMNEHMAFKPEPTFAENGERVFSDYRTGFSWEAAQAEAGSRYIVIPYMLSSDFLRRATAPYLCTSVVQIQQ